MKGQKNVCTYIARSEAHWRAKLLTLLCEASGMTESRLFGQIYEEYLLRLKLIDRNRKPNDEEIKKLTKQARATPGAVKLPHLPASKQYRMDAKNDKA